MEYCVSLVFFFLQTIHSSNKYATEFLRLGTLLPSFPPAAFFSLHIRDARTGYRCEDGRFPASANCLTISNPESLSSSKKGVKSRNKTLKKHLSEWARCQKAIGGIHFTNKWRAETLQTGLEFDNFKPRLKSGIFKCISWLNGSLFEGWLSGFSERGSQDLSKGTNVAS